VGDGSTLTDITAAQVGAVPVTGGTITGSLSVEGNLSVGPTDGAATVSVNGKVVHSSSRELKENITELSSQEVAQVIQELNPVKFTYKSDETGRVNIGFIAEETPDLVCSSDKKAVTPFDIVAILTKAVKEHRQVITKLGNLVKEQQIQIDKMRETIETLEQKNQKKSWFG
jgi:hypothetical protein